MFDAILHYVFQLINFFGVNSIELSVQWTLPCLEFMYSLFAKNKFCLSQISWTQYIIMIAIIVNLLADSSNQTDTQPYKIKNVLQYFSSKTMMFVILAFLFKLRFYVIAFLNGSCDLINHLI